MKGTQCTEPCDRDEWGKNCQHTCHCVNDQPCDGTTGACLDGCAEWYAGDDCSYELPRLGSFTPDLQVIRQVVITVNFTHILLQREGIKYYIQYKYPDITEWYSHNVGETGLSEFTGNFNTTYVVKLVPYVTHLSLYGEPSQAVSVTTGCNGSFWGPPCQHQCRCANDSELCDLTTGKCTSGCKAMYVGLGCQIKKPSLRNSTIKITTEEDGLNLVIPTDDTLNLRYLIEYRVHSNQTNMRSWHNITIGSRIRKKRSNTNSNVLSFTPEGNHINCMYDIKITPMVDQPEYVGAGDPSDIMTFEVGCGKLSQITTFQDACSNWCRCSNDPTSFCLLTCDHCYVCDTEPALPSEEDVNMKLSDISSTSMKISVDSQNEQIFSYRLSHREMGNGSQAINTVLRNRTTVLVINNLVPHTDYLIAIYPQLVIDVETIDSYPLLANASTLSAPKTNKTVLIASVVAVTVCILIVIVCIVLFFVKKINPLKRLKAKYIDRSDQIAAPSAYANMPPSGTTITPKNPYVQQDNHPVLESNEYTAVSPQMRKSVNPIDVKHIKSYVHQLTQDGVGEEYNHLTDTVEGTYHAADMPRNKNKNRFKNNKAYDHSRVILKQIGRDLSSTYINANYMSGFQLEKEFIGCQAPLKNTVNDIWRMIWEQNVNTIVMLTRCTEDGRQKSFRYWPDKGATRYGQFKVEHLSSSNFSFYVERHFVLSENEISRHITQLQYTSWPDHDTPATSCEYLEFHTKVEMLKSKRTGPLVVHCSAGLGRTGTFIAIDYLKKQAKTDYIVDVPACVTSLREDRAKMVQTLEQYRYGHENDKIEILSSTGK